MPKQERARNKRRIFLKYKTDHPVKNYQLMHTIGYKKATASVRI